MAYLSIKIIMLITQLFYSSYPSKLLKHLPRKSSRKMFSFGVLMTMQISKNLKFYKRFGFDLMQVKNPFFLHATNVNGNIHSSLKLHYPSKKLSMIMLCWCLLISLKRFLICLIRSHLSPSQSFANAHESFPE